MSILVCVNAISYFAKTICGTLGYVMIVQDSACYVIFVYLMIPRLDDSTKSMMY